MTSSAQSPVVQARGTEPRTARVFFWHASIRSALAVFLTLIKLAKLFGRKSPALPSEPLQVLITGTFHSENWIEAHLRPLASSARVERVRMVAASSVPSIKKVEVIYPPQWLSRMLGGVTARMLQFVWTALTTDADVIGGFHLLFNGMLAALLGRWTGATSLYICGGGVQEIIDGGLLSENRVFQKLAYPDKNIEGTLVKIASECDLIITMGERAIAALSLLGVNTRMSVISGGRDGSVFNRDPLRGRHCEFDLIFVGRLAPIKKLDVFLKAIQLVRQVLPEVRAVFVGDGPLREPLEVLARELGISQNVLFVGLQRETHTWLARSRVFGLTSETEGLSLSLIEAMMTGLPAVVPDVGDLADLVHHGETGFVVKNPTAEEFAIRFLKLLTNPALCEQMASDARRVARRFETTAAAGLWDQALTTHLDKSVNAPVPVGRGD